MKLNSPLPQSLPKECAKAAKIFKSFVDSGNNGLDGVVPRAVLQQAKGFAIFTIFKAGFLFSARAGTGVVIAKLDDGTWSSPSAIGTAGLGIGGQAGAEVTDFLIVLNSKSAVKTFMAAGSLSLGGNMSLAVGPLGRNGEAIGSLNTSGKVAAMYSYSKTKGLFGGVSIEGTVIVEREDANVQAYGAQVSAKRLLGGSVDPPQWASVLINTLESCTGLPGNRTWIDDNSARDREGGYAFGSLSSPKGEAPPSLRSRSSSFLRRNSVVGKKKAYPPAEWGEETNTGSYFNSGSTFDDTYAEPVASTSTSARTKQMANPFETKFDSDFDFAAPTPTTNKQSHRISSSMSKAMPRSPYNDGGHDDLVSHTRSMSLASPANSRPYSTYTASPSLAANPFNMDNTSNPSPSASGSFTGTTSPGYIAPKPELSRPLQPGELGKAIALYDFEAVESGDLSFKKGDVITITSKSESVDDWWSGKVGFRTGIFPANFIETV